MNLTAAPPQHFQRFKSKDHRSRFEVPRAVAVSKRPPRRSFWVTLKNGWVVTRSPARSREKTVLAAGRGAKPLAWPRRGAGAANDERVFRTQTPLPSRARGERRLGVGTSYTVRHVQMHAKIQHEETRAHDTLLLLLLALSLAPRPAAGAAHSAAAHAAARLRRHRRRARERRRR